MALGFICLSVSLFVSPLRLSTVQNIETASIEGVSQSSGGRRGDTEVPQTMGGEARCKERERKKEERKKLSPPLLFRWSIVFLFFFLALLSVLYAFIFWQSASMASSSLRSSAASVATTSRSAATARLSSPPKPTSSIGRRNTNSQVVAAVGEKVTDWKKPSDKYSGFKYDFANSVSSWRERERDRNERRIGTKPSDLREKEAKALHFFFLLFSFSRPTRPRALSPLLSLSHTYTKRTTRTKKQKTHKHSHQRWVRVSKDKNEESGNKYTSENWEAGGATRVQPKSGSEYTVWPVVHALLTERGLDDVDAEEALRLQQAGKAIIVDCRPTYQVRDFFLSLSLFFLLEMFKKKGVLSTLSLSHASSSSSFLLISLSPPSKKRKTIPNHSSKRSASRGPSPSLSTRRSRARSSGTM